MIYPDETTELEGFAGMDGLGPIKEDSTKKCIAALHSEMLHSKFF
mgnify:CR=1 FL=1